MRGGGFDTARGGGLQIFVLLGRADEVVCGVLLAVIKLIASEPPMSEEGLKGMDRRLCAILGETVTICEFPSGDIGHARANGG